ncbi:MAG: hypothetical protein MJZ90_07435 [Bacteroidales bacterium]|nr:hypothetical protein [Bacteroidales bacterium]
MSTATATYRKRKRMNGCMYEPVQDPTSQQGFNRYAYCFYNPLKYVDPTGERCYGPSWVDLARMCDDWVMEQKRAAFQMGLTMVESHFEEASFFANLLFSKGDEVSGGSNHDNSGVAPKNENGEMIPDTSGPMAGDGDPTKNGDGKNNLQTNNIGNTPNDQNLVLIGEQKFIHDEFVNTNTDYYLDFKGGQHIRIVLEESNISSQISIRDETTYYIDYVMGIVPRKVFDGNDGMGGNGGDFVLIHSMPQNHDFYRFAECPIDWRIHISTTSKIANVKIYIYSSYVP